ncbi:MAG: 4a-hydroxytetrahydrobiopterin dehydratase [Nanoarchaeota archaeon]
MMNLARIQARMKCIKDWSLEGDIITKEIEFEDFREAIDYVDKVADIAEKNDHHPDILIKYNIVKLSLTTHSEKNLTEEDFDVAEEIDGIKI